VAARLGVTPVLVDQRPDQPVPVAEVILDRAGVALTRGSVDLPQGHAVDAVRGEELFRRSDDLVPGVVLDARAHRGAVDPSLIRPGCPDI
jgi:hypothetical protein